jgi:hypothetical protein
MFAGFLASVTHLNDDAFRFAGFDRHFCVVEARWAEVCGRIAGSAPPFCWLTESAALHFAIAVFVVMDEDDESAGRVDVERQVDCLTGDLCELANSGFVGVFGKPVVSAEQGSLDLAGIALEAFELDDDVSDGWSGRLSGGGCWLRGGRSIR